MALELTKIQKEVEEQGKSCIDRPSFWGGYEVTPDRIEFWQGHSTRFHDRFVYTLGKENGKKWKIDLLSP